MIYTDCEKSMEGLNFNKPTQVKFKLNEMYDNEGPLGGIAYEDKILCGCCGGFFEFADCIEVETLPWVNISNEILGDNYE